MNIVYYLVGLLNSDKKTTVTGGHGYTYDPSVAGKKKVNKNVATQYGYYAEANYQNSSVVIDQYLNGRVTGQCCSEDAFLHHLDKLLDYYVENDSSKLLIATNMVKIADCFKRGCLKTTNAKLLSKVYSTYQKFESNIMFETQLYPKGGIGVKLAHDQANIANVMVPYTVSVDARLDVINEKEFSTPTIEFNHIVTANRWYFTTGNREDFYRRNENDERAYFFGHVEPDKNYYGKATPDATYGALYTKDDIGVLDKLYEHCKNICHNPLDHLLAGNLNFIKSKEITRMIDMLPREFEGNRLISPIKIATADEPELIELLNPAGLAYRIRNSLNDLQDTYRAFNKRFINKNSKTQFMDITHYFFVEDGKKLKLSPEFSNNTIKFSIPVNSPHCRIPVNINLSIKYDCPSRDAFNSLLKNKIHDIKVYLVLDFSGESGVYYSTIVETPRFTYLHANSIANLRVYNLKERNKEPS